jgi:hemolysin III
MRSPNGSSAAAAQRDRHGLPKPLLRGRIHQVAFFTAIPAGIVLVWLAPTTRARIATLVFVLSMVAQFGVSSMYHVGEWIEAQRNRMRQLDHSMIFVLIAGSYTPFCLLVLHGKLATVVLSIVWAGAAIGVGTKLYRVDMHVLSGFMYLGLGWAVVATFPALVRALDPSPLALLVAGGVLYTLGALVLATHHPNPWPKTFGYHEAWHTMTVLAAASHYTAILLVVLSLR